MASNALPDEVKWELFRHTIYLFQGICIILFNTLIILTIVRHQALRDLKEYVSLAALATGDALHGVSALAAALHRMPLWLTNNDKRPASNYDCLFTVHNFGWAFTTPFANFMLAVVSLDRLLSVAVPLRHLSLKRSYMFWLVGLAWGLSMMVGTVIYGTNWNRREDDNTEICWSSDAYGMDGSYLRDGVITVNTMVSIGVYLCVPIAHAYHKRKVQPVGGGHAVNQQNNRLQKELNKAVSLSCLFTFFCVGLPWFVQVWMAATNAHHIYESISVWMFITSNINHILNLGIYYMRQKYFRIAFKALFQNKTLPPSLELWRSGHSVAPTKNAPRPARIG